MKNPLPFRRFGQPILVLLLVLYMVAVGLYFVLRYNGHWMENDSAVLTQAIQTMSTEGQLVPSGDKAVVYGNGYAYQVISIFLIGMTGLDVLSLQQLFYPILTALIVLPAYALYREMTGKIRAALIATILLFTQPEFLFVILRSSHEKYTRTFMLLCLFLLLRSMRQLQNRWSFVIYVALFYISSFALIASNNLLAHSFILSIAIALLLGQALKLRNPSLRNLGGHTLHRFTYILLTSLGLVYLFIFYLYRPAEDNLYVLRSIVDRISALILDVEQEAHNSYATVQATWISLPIYFAVSIGNWLLLASSFVIWCRQGLAWVVRRETPPSRAAWITWLLYGSLAVQGGLSILIDASGALSSNLQVRLFPSFSLIGVAIVAREMDSWRPHLNKIWQAGIAMTIACIALLSVLKATTEPLLSNKWIYYHSSELTALSWADQNLHSATIWTEFDERLSTAYFARSAYSPNDNGIHGFALRPNDRMMLVSTISRFRSLRLNYPLPVLPDALQVYDNGETQLYRQRPYTAYQR